MKTLTDHEVFWLARYAHNTLAPLFAEVKAIEPSLQFHIELNFADRGSAHNKDNSLGVNAHWSRNGMFLQSICQRTKADIDKVAVQVRTKLAALKDTEEISALLESVSV